MAKPTRRKIGLMARLCMDLGAGLLENGAETSRVEETIRRAAESIGMEAEAVVNPTGITLSVGHHEPITRVVRIHSRGVDLTKVAQLNGVSRLLYEGHLEVEQAAETVEEIRNAQDDLSLWRRAASTAVGSACFTVLAGGGPGEALAGLLAGAMVARLLSLLEKNFPPFMNYFFAALLVTWWSWLWVGRGFSGAAITVGALTPQMPGLALVAAMRDLMAGELVSGTARGAEAVLMALAMAAGVTTGLSMLTRMGL